MVDRRKLIEEKAYEIWEHEGRPAGRDVHHWLEAETRAKLEEEQPKRSARASRGGKKRGVTAKNVKRGATKAAARKKPTNKKATKKKGPIEEPPTKKRGPIKEPPKKRKGPAKDPPGTKKAPVKEPPEKKGPPKKLTGKRARRT